MKKLIVLIITCISVVACTQKPTDGGTVKMDSEELKKRLTPLQYHVTMENGTEKPFENEFWNNKKPGIYVDIISGDPLFSSTDKYKSGTGWPSFTRKIKEASIAEKVDNSLYMKRVEVRGKKSDGHLGHVFDDGPGADGKRFCINSAALRFIPLEELEKQGYEEFLSLFKKHDADNKSEVATFGGGCFWGVEAILKKVNGIIDTTAGYAGGSVNNPDYSIVSGGNSGHAEVVRVEFNPSIISYEELLSYFWRLHDPTTLNRQGWDRGTQYRSVVFYHTDEQKKIAEESKKKFDRSGVFKKKSVTEITPASGFYKAEEYHQDYYDKKGGHVCHTLRER